MWMSGWRRLTIYCGRMVWRRVWDPRWSIGSVSIIRPSITLASLVWWPGCHAASAKKKRLSSIQRLACLGITGAAHTIPAGAMEALTCLPSLELAVQGEARLAALCRVWDVGLTFTAVEDTVVYWSDFSSRTSYLIWGSMLRDQHWILNPNIWLGQRASWLKGHNPITAQINNTWQFVLFSRFFWERSASVSVLWAATEA